MPIGSQAPPRMLASLHGHSTHWTRVLPVIFVYVLTMAPVFVCAFSFRPSGCLHDMLAPHPRTVFAWWLWLSNDVWALSPVATTACLRIFFIRLRSKILPWSFWANSAERKEVCFTLFAQRFRDVWAHPQSQAGRLSFLVLGQNCLPCNT